MKTQTKAKAKPQTAKAIPASAKAAPVKPQAAKVDAAQAAPVVKATLAANAKGLFWLQMTPGGNALRAYFLALITAQVGDLPGAIGKVFRLWPDANIRGHLASRKIERKPGGYALTTQGVNYFTDPREAADPQAFAKWSEAIRTGKTLQGYGPMQAFDE
jgi:hypothetical protein